MTSRHSLYKSKSKMAKANYIQKTMSSMQRKVNILSKEKKKLLTALTKRKEQSRKDFILIEDLKQQIQEEKK